MKVKKEEIKQWINDVYTKLWDLFSLYEETDGYLTVPEGETKEEFRDFISRKFGEIRRIGANFSPYMDEQEIAELKKLKPGLMAIEPGLAATIDPEVREVSDRLQQILYETKQFLSRHMERCEELGAVFRWQAMNPHLTYFANIFDLMEKYPETYREMEVRGGQFIRLDEETISHRDRFHLYPEYPGPELFAERNAYFEKIKERNEQEKLSWSKNRIFQEELLNTLKLLFECDFKEYL